MEKLRALYPILYLSKQYAVGDELPASDQTMVDAWLEAGTASWQVEDDIRSAPVKANPAAAQAGFGGIAIGSETDGDDLVGVIPKTAARNKKVR